MRRSLSSQDCKAVDLFLDRGQALDSRPGSAVAGQIGGGFVDPQNVDPLRVQSAAKVLAMLQQFPANDPPPDLLHKTLRRIQQHVAKLSGESVTSPGMIIDLPPAT